MTIFHKITEYNKDVFRGGIIRLVGRYPYEERVDFMVFDTMNKDRPYGLIVTTGYKSGLIVCKFPIECAGKEGGVSIEWIKKIGTIGFTQNVQYQMQKFQMDIK
ncbi:Imm45 family immunity protein [Komagataeibacter europaeus]|uniref:Imm45 family immunity protein n=1 Tax=Komagataeibacter europaeus TaxID=33995 RepID=UPI001C716BDD|nr:Imm45 family immunity protein [Komagataeibacter europaeus]